jgi:glutamate synthase (NADPH/NADH) large chain
VIEPDLSDSGSFDNVLELLRLGGRSLPESVMMMIPEAWQNHHAMPQEKKDFYKFYSAMMEPWDGPASVGFTDGHYIGAVLDRNGLRPSRYYVTSDDEVIMASEVGVVPVDPAKVIKKGRLQPGKMFLVDFEEGRIVSDEEIKAKIAGERPYGEWLAKQEIHLNDLSPNKEPHGFYPQNLLDRMKMFGFTSEHLEIILKPCVENSKEPLGSMGNDAPLAVLSDKPRLVYDYFKQLFAQVTNPPIDSIREEVIMSLESFIGPELNLLDTTENHCHRLLIPNPILTNEQLAALKHVDHRGWKAKTIDMTFDPAEGKAGLVKALDRIAAETEEAIAGGFAIAVLSDRAAGTDRVPVPALLAVGNVHHYLVKKHLRTQIGIVLESGEPREVHHYCMLTGYGVDAVNPYLAFEAMWQMSRDEVYEGTFSDEQIVENYIKAMSKGMRKVFGKMGISTLESYKGAQIFECVGLAPEVIDRCFVGTSSRIKGAGFDILAEECLRRHALGYPAGNEDEYNVYENPGDYQFRAGGEKHMWDPASIADMQRAARQKDQAAYDRFSANQNQRSKTQATIRGLLRFKPGQSIPLDQVQPASEIVKRFATGAMSYGSISAEAHETLAIAMNRLGGKSNTGEGGEDPQRFNPLPNGDSKRSAIKQVASGRFGVTIEYLTNSDEIQIKMAQGAKPGEGGELPGHKVNEIIAKTRHSTPGVGLISPPPHHDIYSIEDLAQLIFDLKNSNPNSRISVKLVSEIGVGTIAAGVSKGHADHILISGHDGGTGASAITGIKNAGLPWELGISETHQTLVMNNLRSRVVLQTDGQLKTGRDVVIAAILGAEEFGFATAALISVGCIMMRKCQKNTCPVGIATQNAILRGRFEGKPEHLENYFLFVAEEARKIMAELGIKSIDELVGRVDLIEEDPEVRNWKSEGVDLTPVLTPAKKSSPDVDVINTIKQDHGIDRVLDNQLILKAKDAIEGKGKVVFEQKIINTDRATGTMLSHEITKKYGSAGLPEGSEIVIHFKGSAGQSFGAWNTKGVYFDLEGDANDYVGKGLSGGTLAIYPPKVSPFKAHENIIIGNVAFYGATSGHAYISGVAAERFCVRNSGAEVVVEGVGDHGLEYMTGGRAIILGETGRNFAAGMSGGIGYVWDRVGDFEPKVNMEMVALETPTAEDYLYIKDKVQAHIEETNSERGKEILEDWEKNKAYFVKVMPTDYKRVLAEMAKAEKAEV